MVDRRDVVGTLKYVESDATVYRRFVSTGIEVNTFGFDDHDVPIRDGRPERDRLTLDTVGFTLLDHSSAVNDFYDEDEIRDIYTSEVIEAVKSAVGAQRVASQGWTIRTSDAADVDAARKHGYRQGKGNVQPPGTQVHIDAHANSADRLAKALYDKHFPGGPEYSRFISFSLWRAFSDPPQDWPLALCDATSVRREEGLRNVLIFTEEVPPEELRREPIDGEALLPTAALFKFNPRHRWWYFPDMTRDEALLFKFHDSRNPVTWGVPHAPFHDHAARNAHARKSIEVRCTAYFD